MSEFTKEEVYLLVTAVNTLTEIVSGLDNQSALAVFERGMDTLVEGVSDDHDNFTDLFISIKDKL